MPESKIINSDWKFLAGIEANINFESQYFYHKDCVIRILSELEDKTDQTQEYHLVEVYSKREIVPDIEAAYYKSFDLLNEFLDQLSFISFQPAFIIRPIAITYARTKLGDEFPMLHSNPSTIRKTITISDRDYVDYSSLNKDRVDYYNLLRILNYYQNAHRLDEKFLHLYSALDQIASIEATEFQVKRCDKCGHKITLNNKSTGNYIKELAIEYNIDGFNLTKIRGFRAKVAHGAKKRDYHFFKELSKQMPALETLVYKVMATRLPIEMKLTTNIHMFTPLLILRGVCKKSNIVTKIRFPQNAHKKHYYNIIEIKMSTNVLFTNVSNKSKSISDLEVNNDADPDPSSFLDGSFGIDFGPNGELPISKYSWPYCD